MVSRRAIGRVTHEIPEKERTYHCNVLMYLSRLLILTVFMSGLIYADVVFAAEVKVIDYEKPSNKKLTIQVIRSEVAIKEYTPPYQMRVYKRKKQLRYDTPENAIASMIAAVKHGWVKEAQKNYFGDEAYIVLPKSGHPWYQFEDVGWFFTRQVDIPGGLWIWVDIKRKQTGEVIGRTNFFVARWKDAHWGKGDKFIDSRQRMYARRALAATKTNIERRVATHVGVFRHWINMDEVPLLVPLQK